MKNFKEKVVQFIRDEEGLELSEYAVAGSLIVLAVVLAFTTLGTEIGLAIDRITAAIKGEAPAG
ncbi:Flp family type IVb pilin [Marinobacter sp.]|uniref:Flp family type IVb pilin n=1 Tax=Marinobacter sp. TaxID=50741 RepID=UPI0034A58619